MSCREQWLLHAQPFATFCSAPGQNQTATLGGHTGTKTMYSFSVQIAGLVCTLHELFLNMDLA